MRHYEIAATTPNQPMSDWCQLMALCKYPHVLRRPVAVTVTCNGAKHLFSVNRDWSVSSEHNLEQDRLLAVLGGEEHQCLKLEMYVGRLRELAEFHARRRKYPIRFIEPGVWEADLGTYNRRLAQIARRRRRLGLLGRMNCGMRHLIPGFTLKRSDMFRLFPMLGEWAWLELKEGWLEGAAGLLVASGRKLGKTTMRRAA